MIYVENANSKHPRFKRGQDKVSQKGMEISILHNVKAHLDFTLRNP